jgi:hypothetical protein
MTVIPVARNVGCGLAVDHAALVEQHHFALERIRLMRRPEHQPRAARVAILLAHEMIERGMHRRRLEPGLGAQHARRFPGIGA